MVLTSTVSVSCNIYNAFCQCGASCELCSIGCLRMFCCISDTLKETLKKVSSKEEEGRSIHRRGMLLEEGVSLFYRSVLAWILAFRGGLVFIYYFFIMI